ncbi:homoserine kinase [Sphingomonas sp. ST-64]|uniref:Homoserine kinase n=1 Tax=Sphingomonas plantiphila TaxID=3163295 RepID=A0ABW8YPK1_9SPHN
MAVYTQVPAESLAAFLARYDVGELVSAKGIAEGVENSNYLVDTTRGRFILTLYEKRVDAGDLPYFMSLLAHLDAKGLPVPPAIPDRAGVAIQELEGRPACLIKFLSGVSLSHPTPGQAEAAARAMADMHLAVADFGEDRPNSMGIESWRPLFERCGASLDDIAPGLDAELGAALDRVLAAWPRDGFDRCAIHADLFPDNVLMLGEQVTGLIDFYFASTDIRIYDLAIMHSAWSFGATGAEYHHEIGDALLRGYESRFPLSDAERAAFPLLASGACIRFALSRAFDWINTPADALVTRKDPLAYVRRLRHYEAMSHSA